MNNRIYWLIEKGSPAEYVAIQGNFGDRSTGRLYWTVSSLDALRFNRERDAILFVGLMRDLSQRARLSDTLKGLRYDDEVPRICDHKDEP